MSWGWTQPMKGTDIAVPRSYTDWHTYRARHFQGHTRECTLFRFRTPDNTTTLHTLIAIASGLHQNHRHRAVHQALSILEEVKGVSMAGVGWRLASSMGSACRWAMSSRGERAHTASQMAGERAVRSGACGEDGGAWAAGAPGSRASNAASRASAPRRGAAAWACCERACQAAPDCAAKVGNHNHDGCGKN